MLNGKIRCGCGSLMDLEDVSTSTGRAKIYLCRNCPLAWTPLKQWIPDRKEWMFKLPNGKLEYALEIHQNYIEMNFKRNERIRFLQNLFS